MQRYEYQANSKDLLLVIHLFRAELLLMPLTLRSKQRRSVSFSSDCRRLCDRRASITGSVAKSARYEGGGHVAEALRWLRADLLLFLGSANTRHDVSRYVLKRSHLQLALACQTSQTTPPPPH